MKNTHYATPRRPSVSSWALHPLLGTVFPGRPGDPDARLMTPHAGDNGATTLLDLPARLAAHGFRTMEICHFHIPSRDAAYLSDLRAALDAAGVELWSLLIDDGDITHPERHARDRDWIAGWVDVAGTLGAKRTRVIAGKQEPNDETLARSRDAFAMLAAHAAAQDVRVMTENWFSVLSRPEHVHALLKSLDGAVGLCLDFGNWGGPTKYDDLAAIAPLAESCHAKCDYPASGQPDTDDYSRCLEITRAADFSGPFTLVYSEPGDEWNSLAAQRALLAPYTDSPAAAKA